MCHVQVLLATDIKSATTTPVSLRPHSSFVRVQAPRLAETPRTCSPFKEACAVRTFRSWADGIGSARVNASVRPSPAATFLFSCHKFLF